MVKHIVMWKFKDEAEGKSKEENIAIVKAELEALKGVIPQITEDFEVGVNFTVADTAYDAVLLSSFKSKEDLLAYRNDPRHKKAAAYNKLVRSHRVVVDYEY
ncbi:MAG: Dabb family protein [Spirochaetales bacterium]|nr:Dabb family protein [Spirochaetales bacterium]